jgi:murein DD-endopeptidase MepM/ murein hydrolase activator NlpD
MPGKSMYIRQPKRQPNHRLVAALSILIIVFVVLGYFGYRWYAAGGSRNLERTSRLMDWLRSPDSHPEWALSGAERCGDAPFLLPTSGYIGFLWGDSFRPGHQHQGIDIFGGEDPGLTAVYAAYDGYLTRLPEWKSSLIIRIPSDPLQPSRQVWTYYTHLASKSGESFISPDFPPGASDVFVQAGTLLGYQGNYSGDPNNPTGVHLHFSIVKDDGSGSFLNELKIKNTIDPSPYFGLALNAQENQNEIPLCKE